MPTRSHRGWKAILASRSSRAIVPAFMPRAPVAVHPVQRRSRTAGIFLQNLGEAMRIPVDRHRKAVGAAGKAMTSEMVGNDDRPSPKLDCLRRSGRNQRSELYAEILQLREADYRPDKSHRGLA